MGIWTVEAVQSWVTKFWQSFLGQMLMSNNVIEEGNGHGVEL